MLSQLEDTIYALATPKATSAIAIIRITGKDTHKVLSEIFRPLSKKTTFPLPERKAVFGKIYNNDELIDEILVTFFKNPASYTGEDLAEISCHGSVYICEQILKLLSNKGLRIANKGEFTFRAFENGKIDLSQAEAVADLISANSQQSHQLALNQMRGGFSNEISTLRSKLLNFASLIELELDFGEEDVEFANRAQFEILISEIIEKASQLSQSFELGNVIKKGIPVAIVGKPNSGKSTLLNALLREDRALVSDIPGTTRDTIEDTLNINGFLFRFIDTAGLRHSSDEIEMMGIEKTYQKIDEASVILYVVDISIDPVEEILTTIEDMKSKMTDANDKKIILIANKTDILIEAPRHLKDILNLETIFISAKRKENINLISESLNKIAQTFQISDQTIVSNIRHYEALNKVIEAASQVAAGIKSNISGDLLAIDIHTALHHLGLITGEVSSEEVLQNIFDRFCIGK